MLFAVVAALLLLVLNWYVAPTKPRDKKDLVLALAQILAGTALLSGLYFTWRTLQVNREGQITDRFTRAIDQLGKSDDKGNKLLEIRLGGIYALERIAWESERDYWTIMEILTAYVRQHAPWRPEEVQQSEEAAAVEKSEEASAGSRGESEVMIPTKVSALAPDIQAIITVLQRCSRRFRHGEYVPFDLHETNLRGAELWGANLSGANLWRANLSEARLNETDFSRANLSYANLFKADLDQAQLEETKGDENTELPPELKPPTHWGVKIDEQVKED